MMGTNDDLVPLNSETNDTQVFSARVDAKLTFDVSFLLF
jgi:hypothetical protein